MDGGQDRSLVDEWLGQVVHRKYMGAKPRSKGEIDNLVDDSEGLIMGRRKRSSITYSWKDTTGLASRFGTGAKKAYGIFCPGGPS